MRQKRGVAQLTLTNESLGYPICRRCHVRPLKCSTTEEEFPRFASTVPTTKQESTTGHAADSERKTLPRVIGKLVIAVRDQTNEPGGGTEGTTAARCAKRLEAERGVATARAHSSERTPAPARSTALRR